MENFDPIQFIKDEWKKKSLFAGFLVSLITLLVVFALFVGLAWNKRVELFGYFAREYLQEAKNLKNVSEGEMDDEEILAGQNVFSQESFVVAAAKKANPAVVSIIISKEVPKYETYYKPREHNSPFPDLFPEFFFNIPEYRENGTELREVGGGSGFFVSSDGLLVTNQHVVDQEGVEYTVFTNDGKKHNARVMARDAVLDIAILKVDQPGTDFPYLTFGNSDSLEVGQSVIAIGNALGEFRNTVSVGVVSGLARTVAAGDSFGRTEVLDHVIQTDAAINPGNSGGPLLDLSGKVIGVNVAVARGSQSVGFALSGNSVVGAIESVKSVGRIVRPLLGVRYMPITAELKKQNSLSVNYGVLVKAGVNPGELAVIPGSPADKAGIVENDIILEVDGVKLDAESSLASLIRKKKVGQVVTLKILHRGSEKTVQATLEENREN